MYRFVLFALILSVAFATSTLVTSKTADAAPPSGGIYDIAILNIGNDSDWDADNSDFQRMIQPYTRTNITAASLTAGGLAPFDVLILPWDHSTSDINPGSYAAIVSWVNNGGTLIIGPACCGNDGLLAAFGASYQISWDNTGGDEVFGNDFSNPIVGAVYGLDSGDLSFWNSSFHSILETWGSAWKIATLGAIEDQAGQRAGAAVSACATSGSGRIVVQGQDPEFHGTNGGEQGAFKLIANEVTIGSVPCTGTNQLIPIPAPLRQPPESSSEPQPNVGGALQAILRPRATPTKVAGATGAAPTAGQTLGAPRTGDAGLADKGNAPFAALVIAIAVATGAGVVLRRRDSR